MRKVSILLEVIGIVVTVISIVVTVIGIIVTIIAMYRDTKKSENKRSNRLPDK